MFENSTLNSKQAAVIPLGFVLILGILVTGIHVYETHVVPKQAEDVEIGVNKEVQNGVQEFSFSVSQIHKTKQPQPLVFGKDAEYPLTFPAPRDPRYAVRTTENETGSFKNSSCVSGTCDTDYKTRTVIFQSDYSYFETPRTYGFDHGVIYTAPPEMKEGDTQVATPVNQQLLIDGKEVLIPRFRNSFKQTGYETVSYEMVPSRYSQPSFELTNSTSGPLVLEIPTELSEEEWRVLLEDEMVANGGNIENLTYETTGSGGGSDEGDAWYSCHPNAANTPYIQCTEDDGSNTLSLTFKNNTTYTVQYSDIRLQD